MKENLKQPETEIRRLFGLFTALCALARGTQVLLLAQMEGWAYVQTEIEGTPVRAFLPVSAIL